MTDPDFTEAELALAEKYKDIPVEQLAAHALALRSHIDSMRSLMTRISESEAMYEYHQNESNILKKKQTLLKREAGLLYLSTPKPLVPEEVES